MADVWLVKTASGEYSSYYETIAGVFVTEALAEAFRAAHPRGENVWVEQHPLLDAAPIPVTVYTMEDVVLSDGRVSPDRTFATGTPFKHFGRTRTSWASWKHLEPEVEAEVGDWDGGRSASVHVKVRGWNRDAVRSKFASMVKEARARALGAAKA